MVTPTVLLNYQNGNGSLCLLPGLLQDAVRFADILVVMEIHESPSCPLPGFINYQWLFVCREEVCTSSGVRGSSGVAYLIQDSLFSATSIDLLDIFARFM